jgi:hypothetical protein
LVELLAMAAGGAGHASPIAELAARDLHEDSGASPGAVLLARALVTVPCARSALRSFMQSLRGMPPSDQTRIVPPTTVDARSAPAPHAFSAEARPWAAREGLGEPHRRTRTARGAIAMAALALSLAVATLAAKRAHVSASPSPERAECTLAPAPARELVSGSDPRRRCTVPVTSPRYGSQQVSPSRRRELGQP